MFRPVEMKSAPDETDFLCTMPDVIVKVRCISPGRDKHNHQGIRLCGFRSTLAYPGREFTAVGGITEHTPPPPNFV